MAIELLFETIPSKGEIPEAMALADGAGLPAWGLGRAYASLQDKGYGQKAIASAIGRSQQHISMCITIFRGLAPEAYAKLCRLGSAGPDVLKIVQIARLRVDEEPDLERQIDAIEKIVRKHKPQRHLGLEQTVVRQFLKLRELRLPDHARPFVAIVIAYLSGESSLTFPEPPCRSTTETPAAPRPRTSRSRSTS